jgi:DNA-binding transcriptional LysR family regulator
MDIDLARTFLTVVSEGSFIAAGERLNLTQTAISARIRTLENQLGPRLFVRNKSGARLTAAGERFMRHATALVQIWDGARQQMALPTGRADMISLGGEPSLSNPFLAQWLAWMKRECPEITLRVDIDVPGRLVERVNAGTLDFAVLDSPQQRPNLVVELLLDEKLVMVTTSADGQWSVADYVHIDWGPEFAAGHQAAFPQIANPPVAISPAPLALAYLLAVGGAGYFRSSVVREHIAQGRLHKVSQAPEFSHSIYLIYSTQHEIEALHRVRAGFQACAANSAPGAIAILAHR